MIEYAKELSDKYPIVRGTTRKRRVPERFGNAYSVGDLNISNFEEISILIHQNAAEILVELDVCFGADQSGIIRAAACSLPNTKNFLNKKELNTLSELNAIYTR